MSTPQQPAFRYPFVLDGQPKNVQDAHVWAFNAILDLQKANKVNVGKITAISQPSSSGSTTTEIVTENTVVDTLAGLGMVNDQTGQTAYTTQTPDAGILLVLNDASPVAVTLNSTVAAPFALFVTNFGAGTATLTPSTGTINGGASFALLQYQLAWVVFNGTNWLTSAIFTPPKDTPAVTHEWIDAYNAATGVFTQTRPDYSDLTGTPTLPATISPVAGEYLTGYDSSTGLFSQSTPAGLSVTITTAALTTLGTQGSQTFTNGLLTAQTPAT